jgi:hypothetical protein
VPGRKNAVAIESGTRRHAKGRRSNQVGLRELPTEKGTTGSEQTTSARCRSDFPPATHQNGVNVSTAAWTLVSLSEIISRFPEKTNGNPSNGENWHLNA